MELDGNGLLELNPIFVDFNEWIFSYQENSPCINAGDPSQTDPDGSIRDIGANWYDDNNQEPGDCNSDDIQNILDIVYMVNDCILGSGEDCSCGDLNQDEIVNVLDVIILVNSILEIY